MATKTTASVKVNVKAAPRGRAAKATGRRGNSRPKPVAKVKGHKEHEPASVPGAEVVEEKVVVQGGEGAVVVEPEAPITLPQKFLHVLGTGLTDPTELIIDESKNMRRVKHSPQAIQERATSLLVNGQQKPIQVTGRPGGKMEVTAGYLTALAGVHIRENNLTEQPWEIRYELVDEDTDRFFNNVVENLDRKNLTDADLYHAFEYMKRDLNLSQKMIAERLKISDTLVSRVNSVGNNLNARELRMVATGQIKSEHGRELAGMPPEARKPIVDRIAKGEEVTLAEIKSVQVPKGRGNRRGKPAPAKEPEAEPETRALSAKQIGLPFEFVANHRADGEEADAVEKWCGEMVKFRLGKVEPRKLIRSLYTLAGLEVPGWIRTLTMGE